MGKPSPSYVGLSVAQYISGGGQPGELKHLISLRKRKKFDSLSSGERKGKSPNLPDVKIAVVVW